MFGIITTPVVESNLNLVAAKINKNWLPKFSFYYPNSQNFIHTFDWFGHFGIVGNS